jgi:hypothetical protein
MLSWSAALCSRFAIVPVAGLPTFEFPVVKVEKFI